MKLKSKLGIFRCTVCGGAGTAQMFHCGKLMVYELTNNEADE